MKKERLLLLKCIVLIKQIITLSHLQGYTKPREYIVTEWPLHKTLGEFWSLVYDHECSAVVVICNPPPNSVSGVFITELSCLTFDSKCTCLVSSSSSHIPER